MGRFLPLSFGGLIYPYHFICKKKKWGGGGQTNFLDGHKKFEGQKFCLPFYHSIDVDHF